MPLPENIHPTAQALWGKSRLECEQIYRKAFQRNNRADIRFLGQNDRYFLLTCLLRRADVRGDWLYARCREVEQDPDDRLDLWARAHYKSTIITFGGIIQEILFDPEICVGIFAHNRPAAKAFLRQIKEELETNEYLISLYPEILWTEAKKQAPKWSEDDGIIVRRKSNPKESSVEAHGLVDGMPTGKHFPLRVYDDVVTEKSVTTPDMIRKTTDMFDLSDNLGTPTGRMQMIGTRYSFADTYGQVKSRGVIKERRFPATHDGSFDGRPVLLTEEQWERKKRSASKPIIAAQQLLNPLAGSENTFDPRWLRFWEVRPKRLNVYIMVDPSKGATDKSDYTAMSIVGVDVNRNKYLLDGYCHRMKLSRRWQILRDAWRRWALNMPGVAAVFVGYERFGMQSDDEYFEERMMIENVHFSIEELMWPREGQKSKRSRIERLEPDFRTGRFRLPHVMDIDDEGVRTNRDPRAGKWAQECIRNGEPWRVARPIIKKDEDRKIYNVIERFMDEYIFFPFAPNDDFLDATSRIYDMDVQPPFVYHDEPGQALSLAPEVFIDGV